ncbi:MAG: membrane protein [Candidatus Velthaea sp.]
MSEAAPSRAWTTGMLNKVPQVTLVFWIIKILATTVGETAADFLKTKMHLGLMGTSLIMGALFLIALAVQLTRRRYIPAMYWTVVVLVSVVGTLISDNLVDNLGISLQVTSIAFASALAVVFVAWWRSEHTLSVHSIRTTKRELFYWAAILFTFALGTSAGDLLAEAMGIGYGFAALVFASLIALTALAYFKFKLDGVLAFWIAYILTRPLGASMGDLLSQTSEHGGLGLGTTTTSAIFIVVIVALVAYLTVTKTDFVPEAGETRRPAMELSA